MTALAYCTVVGKFTRLDSGSPPVSTPLIGQVTLTPNVIGGKLLLPTETPPRSIVIDPEPVALDGTGSFTIQVVATDQTGVTNPAGFTYTASFQLQGVTIAPFSFAAPSGGTVDLAVVAPAPVSAGLQVLLLQQIPDLSSLYAPTSLVATVATKAVADLHARTHPAAYDMSLQRTAGPLGTFYTGQTWGALGNNPPQYVTVAPAALPAITYGSNPPTAGDEFFAVCPSLGAPVLRAGGRFRIRSTAPSGSTGNVILGIWDGTVTNVVAHLVMTNYQYYFSYIKAGVLLAQTPDVGPATGYLQKWPLVADSSTLYNIDCVIDVPNSRLYVWWPDGTLQAFTNPDIATLSATCTGAFWEGQYAASGDAIVEWTEVYAGTDVVMPGRA